MEQSQQAVAPQVIICTTSPTIFGRFKALLQGIPITRSASIREAANLCQYGTGSPILITPGYLDGDSIFHHVRKLGNTLLIPTEGTLSANIKIRDAYPHAEVVNPPTEENIAKKVMHILGLQTA